MHEQNSLSKILLYYDDLSHWLFIVDELGPKNHAVLTFTHSLGFDNSLRKNDRIEKSVTFYTLR
jgi:hypothetical protein